MRTRYGMFVVFLIAVAAIVTLVFRAHRHCTTLCRVPATRYALGARIVLESVKRMPDGHVQVKMVVTHKTTKAASMDVDEAIAMLRPGKEPDEWGYSNTGTDPMNPSLQVFSLDSSFKVPGRLEAVDLSETIFVNRPEKNVVFRFRNMQAGPQQLNVCKGNASVIIRNVEFNKPLFDERWQAPHDASYCYIPLSIPRTKIEVDATFPKRCGNRLEAAILVDDRGNRYPLMEELIDLDAAIPPPPSLTGVERVVRILDKDRAFAMARDRDRLESRTRPDKLVRILTFPAIYPRPKSVTLEIPSTLPPDPKDVATLTFRNVPVGK